MRRPYAQPQFLVVLSLTTARRSYHRASESERREELIVATLDCIAEVGIQGATVRQIAARAGVTGGLIRHYFSTKDQMLQAAYRKLMSGITEITKSAAEGDSACLRLRRFIVANVTPPVTDSRTLTLWAAFISHIPLDPAFAAIHRESYMSFLAELEALLSAFFAERNRDVSAAEIRTHAIALNGLIDGLWLEGTLAPDLFKDQEIAETAIISVEALLRLAPGELS
ncbi:MAG: TetR family transcriptional regulator C-terminal domain-containing protein [Pseudorhizobium sp.]